MLGQLIFDFNNKYQQTNHINLPVNITQGSYVLSFIHDDKNQINEKIIIR